MTAASRSEADPPTEIAPTPRSGRVAIIGRANVGKSTLLNALVGQKLAIVTPKRHTTRSMLLGVYFRENPPTQIAFVDTPGLGAPRNALGAAMKAESESATSDCDAVIWVTDLPKRVSGTEAILERDRDVLALLKELNQPVIVAINKVDALQDKRWLLPVIEAYTGVDGVRTVVPISAQRGVQLEALIAEVAKFLPEGWLYEPDTVTNEPMRFFAAEYIREAALFSLQQEVPHGLAVQIDEWAEGPKVTDVNATIIVAKSSHKGMVIGAQGSRLKEIGSAARVRLEELLGRQVMLRLWVKVVEDWPTSERYVREWIKPQ